MSLIKFPFTNLHEINLDWIIEEIKNCYSPENPPEMAVLSVNGETGDVILYKNATINFPSVDDTSWTIGRTANGALVGIKFNKGAALQRMNGNSRFAIYDEGNPPPYPVTTVNGHTGDVLIQVAFQDLNQATISFITAAPGHSWSLDRETIDGNISIKLDTTNDTPSAYLEYISADETVTETVRLLTLDDIPSSSGVVSVNGETGVVVLTADEIHRTGANNETVEHAISGLVTDTQNIENKIGTTQLPTTALTITGAIAEHETDITGINTEIGNTSMGTTATTITGAIAEHETDITDINTEIGNTSMGTTATTITGAIKETHDILTYYEDKVVEPIGNYWTRRDAFKASRAGTIITFQGYFQITTQVPSATKFATVGFDVNSGTVALVETGNGSSYPIVVNWSDGSLQADGAIPVGYYRVIGCCTIQPTEI